MQAVLILAHKNFDQVAQLSKLLQRKFEIYIHFDKKYKLTAQQIEWLQKNSIHYISEIEVHWGGWSIGEAAFRLMKLALSNSQITHVHLISGQDWPVMNIDDLYNFYENNNHIYCVYHKASEYRITNELPEWWQKFYFNYDTVNRRTFFGKFYHRFLLYGQMLFHVNKLKKLGINLELYHGANWCDLPRDAAQYCIDYMDNHPEFIKMLETGAFSDEFWVQTILCNRSQFRSRIVNDFHRYVKWEHQNGGWPANLDNRDFELITRNPDYQFARKFEPEYSTELIQKLNHYYHND